jgi:hypothetical protein
LNEGLFCKPYFASAPQLVVLITTKSQKERMQPMHVSKGNARTHKCTYDRVQDEQSLLQILVIYATAGDQNIQVHPDFIF